jgi:GNAT superfamily N-acetyltransferase
VGSSPASSYRPLVRPAELADRDALVSLAETALAQLDNQRGGDVFRHRDARPSPAGPTIDAELAAAMTGDVIVLVGCLGAVPVGYAVATVEATRSLPLAVITDLFVLPEARRVGVGRAMIDSLVERATAAGCGGIQAEALPGDRDTKNFFEASGLVARKITVHRTLTSGISDDA